MGIENEAEKADVDNPPEVAKSPQNDSAHGWSADELSLDDISDTDVDIKTDAEILKLCENPEQISDVATLKQAVNLMADSNHRNLSRGIAKLRALGDYTNAAEV